MKSIVEKALFVESAIGYYFNYFNNMYLFLQLATCPNINISHYNFIVVAKGYKRFLMFFKQILANLMSNQILTPTFQLVCAQFLKETPTFLDPSHTFYFCLHILLFSKMLRYCPVHGYFCSLFQLCPDLHFKDFSNALL